MIRFKGLRLSLQQSIALGFFSIILVGAILLGLPAANRDRQALGIIDALFTATSATCVTGLVIYDTYTQFSLFGQIVILVLIQIGGLGFITVSMFFLLIIGRKINIRGRSLLMESVNKPHIGGVVRLVKRILFITLVLELLGAVLLYIRFAPSMGTSKGAYFGVFHAVSAFCNAGFDLMGTIEPYTSLAPFRGDMTVNLVVVLLIILGGIGFIVWDDVLDHGFRLSHYRLHTKIVLSTTLALIVVSMGIYYLLEGDAELADIPQGERFLATLFQAVTPRTAGFSTLNAANLSQGSMLFTMFLMFIGASPGSTGGGVKTSTFVVILLSVVSYTRGRSDVGVFNRRLDDRLVRRAFNIITVYLLLAITGTLLILVNQNLTFSKVAFETISAIGTVGLSMGITNELTPFSRVVIILLMYAGRVGSLSLVMAIGEKKQQNGLRSVVENISIG